MRDVIRAITLDLDDTLWPIDRVIDRAEAILHSWLEEHAPGVARSLPPPSFAAYRRALALELPAIAHDYTALRLEALRRALEQHGVDPCLAEPGMEVFLCARNEVEFFPDAIEALQRLSARYRVVSLTNGNSDLARIGIGHYFAAVMNARTAGVAKPDARIFHAACACIDIPPDAVLHVGDDPDLDVRGALGAGVRSAWVNRHARSWPGDAVQAVEVRDLLALCDLLGV
jgi:putative hydrolase of the HAD superfamily